MACAPHFLFSTAMAVALSRRGQRLFILWFGRMGYIMERQKPASLETMQVFEAGESGIRTHGDISATLDFESSALDQLSHLSTCVCAGILPVP